MKGPIFSKATLGRLPVYLDYLRTGDHGENISAAEISRALGLGDVQVRKDLNAVSGTGRPKVGYKTTELIAALEAVLGRKAATPVVIVGAGKLGKALYDFEGFEEYGIKISAAFDVDKSLLCDRILSMDTFTNYCRLYDIHAGIITVPAACAKEVCEIMIKSGITAIWNFAQIELDVPENITVCQENLALSLAHLTMKLRK